MNQKMTTQTKMTRRILLRVAYDGTNYHGWQLQPNAATIEGELNRALCALTGEEIVVTGASRTDAGVHALGNVAVFDTTSRIPAEKFSYALNQRLPEDIVIQSSKQVADDFHPRHCDCRKTYEYDILNRTFPLPAYRNTAYFLYGTLNIEAMRQACQAFLGEHDFASFCAAGAQVQTTVRTIYSLEVECRPLTEAGTPVPPASGEAVNAADGKHGEQVQQAQSASGEMLNAAAGESGEQVQQAQSESGETAIPAAGGTNAGSADQLLTIRVKGNGFLYNMVRIIAGTLVEVGRGHIKPEEVAGIIAAKDRAKAGPTAPARGLRLVEIEYRKNQ
ncbi:tRNA pseudouridine synthase A 3 [Roseburia sp. CAG:380]|nr:tRNA pseudouridine synthase A 3 [Roseburia sp. CAG:380]